MKRREGKSGLRMIKPTSFYSCEHEKTKLNWFCYELSMNIYDKINEKLGNQRKKHIISDEALAQVSIKISKKMKGIILEKLSGEIEKAFFSYEIIESYFPNFGDELVNKMLDAISQAWDELISACRVCPTRCIIEKDAFCTMFDDGPL